MSLDRSRDPSMDRSIDLSAVKPAFADPAKESQILFRQIMGAIARPGRIQDLSVAPEPPEGLNVATAAVALTLLDFETPLWLSASLRNGEAEMWLRFHCNCPLVDAPGCAAFAIAESPDVLPRLNEFNCGDEKYPDRSATVIVQSESLSDGEAREIRGPGIQHVAEVRASGLGTAFWGDVVANGEGFQNGVDLMITAGAKLLGLPRTVRLLTEVTDTESQV